jgi:hypothetical protein
MGRLGVGIGRDGTGGGEGSFVGSEGRAVGTTLPGVAVGVEAPLEPGVGLGPTEADGAGEATLGRGDVPALGDGVAVTVGWGEAEGTNLPVSSWKAPTTPPGRV